MRIQDGDTSRAANVDGNGSLQVTLNDDSAPIEVRFQTAADKGEAAYVASAYTAGAGDEVLYIQNLDDKDLVIDQIILSSGAAGAFEIALVTGTAAGTIVTPVAANLSVGLVRSVSVFGNASVTGLTPGVVLLDLELGVGVPFVFKGAPRLQKNDAIVVSSIEAIDVAVSAVLRWEAA